jgi:hypothetical protein
MSVVAFDEATHTYRVGGVIVPSVTTILDAVLGDGFNHNAAAAAFGTNVHKAVALDIRGRLDLVALDPALVPYVDGARKFLRDTEFAVIASEHIVYSASPRYCGTLDLAGYMRGGRRFAVIDFKSGGMPATAGPQTAAYAEAYTSLREGRIGMNNADRYAVMLNARGGYALVPLNDPADWSLFVSCLNVFNWKAKR